MENLPEPIELTEEELEQVVGGFPFSVNGVPLDLSSFAGLVLGNNSSVTLGTIIG